MTWRDHRAGAHGVHLGLPDDGERGYAGCESGGQLTVGCRCVGPAAEREARETNPAEIERLEAHYGHAVSRMLHEYDQRDRDFVMHITINGGLFAAAGLAVGYVRLPAAGSWLVAGLALVVVGVTGVFVANALVGSVNSFVYFQGLLNATLARLEVAILPDPKFGIWCQNVLHSEHAGSFLEEKLTEQLGGIEVAGPRRPANLVNYRRLLAQGLRGVWVFVAVIGSLLVASAVFPALRAAVRVWWPM